jgi:hypothetical protein
MTIKSLIATFALISAATTTAALADGLSIRDHRSPAPQPVVRDHRTPAPSPVITVSQPEVRDHRDHDDRRGDDRDRDWNRQAPLVELGQGHLSGRGETFTVNGLVDKVQFRFVSGTTTINRVAITYANGEVQLLSVGQTLNPNRNQQATNVLDLAGHGRNVKRITVYGRSSRNAAFEILTAA